MKAETAHLGAGALLLTLLIASLARAGDRAGDFSYYVLALSWTPSWCALEGEARGAAECRPGRRTGFTLHGLWPQDERGWPENCRTAAPDPSRAETATMADIMGSAGLAWHEWKTHGRCSGLSAPAYFALARRAWESIERPGVLRKLDHAVRIEPGVVEQAFIEANPGLEADELAVTCLGGMLQGVRVCLTKDLAPRPCTPEVERGCGARSIELPPVR